MKRFWDKVKKSKGCWIWTAATAGGGYGTFQTGTNQKRKTVPAHRISYALTFGPIPKGMFVCHKCDNRKCVRPDHLFIGYAKDNSQDMLKKDRSVAKLSVSQVEWIRRNHIHRGSKENGTQHLALKYNVHPETIRRIIRGDTF